MPVLGGRVLWPVQPLWSLQSAPSLLLTSQAPVLVLQEALRHTLAGGVQTVLCPVAYVHEPALQMSWPVVQALLSLQGVLSTTGPTTHNPLVLSHTFALHWLTPVTFCAQDTTPVAVGVQTLLTQVAAVMHWLLRRAVVVQSEPSACTAQTLFAGIRLKVCVAGTEFTRLQVAVTVTVTGAG